MPCVLLSKGLVLDFRCRMAIDVLPFDDHRDDIIEGDLADLDVGCAVVGHPDWLMALA